jgi:hypothetical protein
MGIGVTERKYQVSGERGNAAGGQDLIRAFDSGFGVGLRSISLKSGSRPESRMG